MPARATGVEVDEPPRTKRPVGVTVVVVLSVLQALLLVVAGVGVTFAAGETEVRGVIEAEVGSARAVGVVVAIIGAVELVLALLLARGSERARSVFGAFNTVHVATAVYGIAALRELQAESVWALAVPVVVLWLLYGSDAAAEYFER